MRSNNQRYSGGKKNGGPKNVLNDLVRTVGGKSRSDAVINKIIYRFQSRTRIQIDTWRDAIAEAENGFYPKRNKWSKVVKDLDLDAHWTSQVTLRKLSVMRKPFKVVNKTTREEIPERTRLFQAPWFYELMNAALDAKFYGTQAVEIQDLLEGNQTWNAIYTVPMGYLKPEMREICLRDYALYGESHVDDPYVLWFDEDTFMGIMVKAAPYLIFKRNALQAWTEYCEKFGIPMRFATTNKKDTATLDKLEQMLDELGRSARAIFPEGTAIDFKEANTQDAYLVFQELIKTCNDEVSKLVNGVTMLSDNGSSKSQSEVHERMFSNIIDSDAADFQSTVNWAVGPQLRKLGHPFNPEQEEWIWDDTELLSKGALWNIAQGVLKFYEVDETWLTEKFGIPVTAKRATPIITSGNTDPAPTNFNKPQPQPAAVGAFAIAEYSSLSLGEGRGESINSASSPYISIINGLLKDFFDKAIEADIPESLYKERQALLMEAFTKGFAPRLDNIAYDSPDNLKAFMYEANIARFSSAATFKEVIEINKLARNSKDFAEFKTNMAAANKVIGSHLETEYNYTVAASQNAAAWLRQYDERKDYDLLYQTVGDARVRDSHQLLDGTVAAVESNIWNSIYPPNGWNCRCEVIQIPKGSRTITDSNKVSTSSVAKGFSKNVGKLDHLFDSTHSYFKEFPDEITLNAKKYGLENWVNLDRGKYPEIKFTIDNQSDFSTWWNSQVTDGNEDIFYKNYLGIYNRLPKANLYTKFDKTKYTDQSRFGIAQSVESILNEPHEVWLNKTKEGNRAVFLKNYRDATYAVITDNDNGLLDVITWYKVEPQGNATIEEALGQLRNGILIRKSQ